MRSSSLSSCMAVSASLRDRLDVGLLAFIAGPDPGELARRLGGAAVNGGLDHCEYRALQRGGQQDLSPALLLVGRLGRVISPADDLPDPFEDQAGEQAAQHAGD